jgi:hypothetical protein
MFHLKKIAQDLQPDFLTLLLHAKTRKLTAYGIFFLFVRILV